ncbi:unnamed protein product [Discosporangium mesarthrocarpum]
MGRPSRKRKREMIKRGKDTHTPLLQRRWSIWKPNLTLETCSMKSLVSGTDLVNGNFKGIATVQSVWGGFTDEDFDVESGIDRSRMEVDKNGVAWLLNPRRCVDDLRDVVPCGTVRDDHLSSAGIELCCVEDREKLCKAKEYFEGIPSTIFKRVRSKCNPAEGLESGPFLNRSAMKLANLDAILGLSLSDSRCPSRVEDQGSIPKVGGVDSQARGDNCLGKGEGILFADLCGGPGGFTEYLVRRRRQLGIPARGWGISLQDGGSFIRGDGGTSEDRERDESIASRAQEEPKEEGLPSESMAEEGAGSCDWRLSRLAPWCKVSVDSKTPPTIHTRPESTGGASGGKRLDVGRRAAWEMSITYGPDGTGDLTREVNVKGFAETVRAGTSGSGVHLVVADGGFGAARDAEDQEDAVKRLFLCEAVAALLVLREGGSMVCKVFEVWGGFTAAVVYVLHRTFDRLAMIKPVTSRPASGERYLVCRGLLSRGLSPITDHLLAVNASLDRPGNPLEVVRRGIMEGDGSFVGYMR